MSTSVAVLPVKERALIALGYPNLDKSVAELKELAAKTANITTITNQAGYGQVHRAEMELKSRRVEITKKGKAARDESNAFNKSVIELEKTLIAAFVDEEERLAALKGEWDAARERERQAEIDAENARIARIQAAIDDIRALPQEAMGKASAHALSVLAEAQAMVLTEAEYQEHLQTAQTQLYLSITALKGIVAERQAAEAEAERVRLERAELAKLRAEAEERERQISIKAAQELHEARQETARLQQIAKEAEQKAFEQTKELERQRRAADEARMAEDLRVQTLQEAESQRLADERAELERRERDLEEASKPKPLDVRDFGAVPDAKPTSEDIVAVLCDELGMTAVEVVTLLASIDWQAELAA